MGVLCLPPAFVFRDGGDDPHPPPWLRVLLACAFGHALYPHAQWHGMAALWRTLYPLPPARAALARQAQACEPFAHWLLEQRPPALQGRMLGEVLAAATHGADTLRRQALPGPALFALPPVRACAVLGQARADGRLAPAEEARRMDHLLTHWALRRSLGPAAP